jgi:uncharacterized protein (TIGR02145 family)
MRKQLTKLALTATIALALTLTTSCGNHSWEEFDEWLNGSSSSEEKLLSSSSNGSSSPQLGSSSSSSQQQSSSSSSQQSSSSRLGSSSSSSGSVKSGVVYGEPVIYQGETYKTVVIGTQTWFQRNLNYAVEGSRCYDNDPANCEKYGRLYNWEMAMAACPSGWHLPSDAEWNVFMKFVNPDCEDNKNCDYAGTNLKATSGWNDYNGKSGNGTDDFGFAALPSGVGYSSTYFDDVGNKGEWWSSSEYKSDYAYSRLTYYRHEYVDHRQEQKKYLLSVRCLKGYSSSSSSKPSSSSSSFKPSSSSSFISPCSISGHKTVKIGSQTWMAQNLNCNVTGSKCYDNDPANCAKYGRLYNWNTAITVCPSGWHLPSNAEWDKLLRYVDGSTGTESPYKSITAGKFLKTVEDWRDGYDSYEFAALPGGYGLSQQRGDNFHNVGTDGYWWSATEYSDKYANYRFMSRYDDAVDYAHSGDYLLSVRCLQDSLSSSKPSSSSSVVQSSNSSSPCNISGHKTVNIGNQTWMAENLNCNVAGSKCYNNDPANCAKYGRLYNWVTAMNLPPLCNSTACAGRIGEKHRGICPLGWHLPSNAEWSELLHFVEGSTGTEIIDESKTAGKFLKATSGWEYNGKSGNGTDKFGFSALSGGFGWRDNTFESAGRIGNWWGASEYDSFNAYDMQMYYASNGAGYTDTDKRDLSSIRCLKD